MPLSDSLQSCPSSLCMSGMQSVLFGLYLLLSSPASVRYMTSSFKKHLLSCRREKLEGNGEGELCESCGNSCQRQLIKHSFISCGVTSINRDALKWPLEGEINHCPCRQRKWTCVCVHTENSNSNRLFVTTHNLQWHGVWGIDDWTLNFTETLHIWKHSVTRD